MITAIRKAPATPAGASPSQRAKSLRRLGTCSNVRMRDLSEGGVIFLNSRAYVVLSTQYDLRRSGARLMLRDLEGATLRSIPYTASGWVPRLQLPPYIAEGEGLWTIQHGDIVMYPSNTPEYAVVAIRHHYGWLRTSAPWAPFSDAEILLHLQEGRVQVIRSSLRRGVQPLPQYPTGSVVACRDARAPEPTVWLRTGEDFWVSNTRGVTASDLMINYELDRRTYHVVRIPEEDR